MRPNQQRRRQQHLERRSELDFGFGRTSNDDHDAQRLYVDEKWIAGLAHPM